jgi:hypothetical protein
MSTVEQRACEFCGRELGAISRRDRRFCSHACRQAGYERRRRAAREPAVDAPPVVELRAKPLNLIVVVEHLGDRWNALGRSRRRRLCSRLCGLLRQQQQPRPRATDVVDLVA